MVARDRRIVGIALLALVDLAGWTPPATAHSLPLRFEPRPDAILSAGPAEVRIVFGGDIEPMFSSIEVTDAGGQRVDKADAGVNGRNPRLLRVSLGALIPGVYRVTWQILAIDGHRNQGSYTFTFKAPE